MEINPRLPDVDFERVQLFLSEGHEMWYETALAKGLEVDTTQNLFMGREHL